MKTDEIKLRVVTFIDDIIDMYMSCDSLIGKIKNSTAKLWVDQNAYKLDSILEIFCDRNNEIDVQKIAEYYEDTLFENGDLRVDIRQIVPEKMSMVKDFLPNKIVVLTRDDLHKLLNI